MRLMGWKGRKMSDDLVKIARAAIAAAPGYGALKETSHVLADALEAQAAEITHFRAELATARREGMEEAAKRLEELHKNNGYNPQTGEVWSLGKLVTCPLTIDHAIGYYRAIAEGVAHILAAAAMKGKKDE